MKNTFAEHPAMPTEMHYKANMPTGNHQDSDFSAMCYGLSKREYFAAMAMQGYIAAGSSGMPTPVDIGFLAVETADRLIEILNK